MWTSCMDGRWGKWICTYNLHTWAYHLLGTPVLTHIEMNMGKGKQVRQMFHISRFYVRQCQNLKKYFDTIDSFLIEQDWKEPFETNWIHLTKMNRIQTMMNKHRPWTWMGGMSLFLCLSLVSLSYLQYKAEKIQLVPELTQIRPSWIKSNSK